MIKFNPEKFTAMVENEFSRATHVFKSPKDAEAFARHILDELANRLVTITITVCGKKVVQSGITFDKANRLKEKFVDAVISEACHFRNDSLKRNYREGIQEYFCRLCPEKSCPETEMFSCECGWAGPETDLCRKYPKNWPEKQFVTEEYACPKCGSFGVEEIDEYLPAFDPEPGERVRLKGMSHAVLILGKKTSLNPMKVKYVGYYWLIGGKRSVSFGPDDIVEIV